MQITATDNDILVQYKEAGKIYNTNAQEANSSADPFDQVTVAAGTSFDLPDGATLIAQRELGGAAGQGGTPDSGIDNSVPDNAPSVGGIATPQGGTPD
jgi:hypothetical protein